MKKKVSKAFGKTIYLLGKDKDGINYWVEESTWDCGWYWSLGYIETYTNNRSPQNSKDIYSHEHFDSKFNFNHDTFKEFFAETTLSKDEEWKLLELMKTGYILKSAAGLFEEGSSHITRNNCYDIIKDQKLYEEIVKVKMPAVISEICNLLGGNTTPKQFEKQVIYKQ